MEIFTRYLLVFLFGGLLCVPAQLLICKTRLTPARILTAYVVSGVVLGGFGLVGLAVGAIFGNVKWKWFASLAIGLVILAIASQVVSYFTNDNSATSSFGDTLQ